MSSRRLLIAAITLMLIGIIGMGISMYTQARRFGSSFAGFPYGGPMFSGSLRIPETLPTPKDKVWRNELLEALALEKLSVAQYDTDESKYGVMMPYSMVIPQERNHVTWIQALFKAYRLDATVNTPQVRSTTSLENAYQVAAELEANLIERYERLIQGAGDNETRQVLVTLQSQSRMHYMMFTHVGNSRMGMFRR